MDARGLIHTDVSVSLICVLDAGIWSGVFMDELDELHRKWEGRSEEVEACVACSGIVNR